MYNASIQREFQNSLLFEIGWIANLANHIGRSSDQLLQPDSSESDTGNSDNILFAGAPPVSTVCNNVSPLRFD